MAQQSEFTTLPIGSEPVIKGVWDKYFSGPHRNIVNNLRAVIQRDPALKIKLVQHFQGFSWPEFADMPGSQSFAQIKETLDGLAAVPGVATGEVKSSIDIYMAIYNLMLQKLQAQAKQPKPPEEARQKAPPKKPSVNMGKVKKLQQMLGVSQTGGWNKETNDAFLSWLKNKGWTKYLNGNRFVGNIDDAISAMLIENAPAPKPAEEANTGPNARAARLEALKKLGI